ncbi:hypothetical protein GGS21DRAFT_152159 [Xylaria nigripes]|nr:hypothetical protein GGS21DRAFT_152159 [Xylaria nigripes]
MSSFNFSKRQIHYHECLQTTPSDARSLMSPEPGRDDKRSTTSTTELNPSYLHHDSCCIPPDGRISPTVALQDGFLSPINSFETTTVLPHRVVSTGAAIRRFCRFQWRNHKAPIFVFAAQLFAALMNLSARLLELGEFGTKLHPMQLLFFRMLVTTLGCSLYITINKIRHGILGPPKVRWMLVIRGLSGFIGIYGMWYSIEYMPLAEATVITFLAPNLTGYWCYMFLGEPYTRTEQLASLLALAGVVLIAKPASLFTNSDPGGTTPSTRAFVNETMATQGIDTAITGTPTTTASERLFAIVVALVGVLGGSIAMTMLRAIGNRAHTLVSVNYFGVVSLIVTFTVLFLAPYLNIGQPDLRLAIPSTARQWVLVAFTAACGLATQVLTTKGLSAERSNRAMAMMYTSMMFAAGFDHFIWGTTLSWMSATGSTMIVIGALWVALGKKGEARGSRSHDEEDVELVVGEEGEEDMLLGEGFEDQNEEG